MDLCAAITITEDYDGNVWIGCIECVAGDSSCKDRLHTLEKLVQSTRGGLTTLGKFSRWRSVNKNKYILRMLRTWERYNSVALVARSHSSMIIHNFSCVFMALIL